VLACIASGGTWAYFQDTITSTDNGVTTGKVSMLFDNIQVGPSGVATVTGVTIPPISPRPLMSATTPIQAHTITNTGTAWTPETSKVILTGVDVSTGVVVNTTVTIEQQVNLLQLI
jgi:predicted ribosomally synthesized peptide with SipW-like signal peptide